MEAFVFIATVFGLIASIITITDKIQEVRENARTKHEDNKK